MLFALALLAGVLVVTMVFNNRRRPARSEHRHSGWDSGTTDSSAWAFGGDSSGDSGSDCNGDAGGGGCDSGGGDGGTGGD